MTDPNASPPSSAPAPSPGASRVWLAVLAVAGIVVLAALLLRGGSGSSEASSPPPAAGGEAPELMRRGMDLLYQGNDPRGAVAVFREVLARNPDHYGAHYQLATALDRSGRSGEANPLWEQVVRMGERYNDTTSLRIARDRLQPVQIAMREGLDLLHTRGDPAGAEARFRRVLELNATHYGAHYQLATALDRLGRAEEARTWWMKMLGMATAIGDSQTVRTARERLAATVPR